MLKDFQTEIKLFLIVALVAVIISIGGILLLKAMQSVPTVQTLPQKSESIGIVLPSAGEEWQIGKTYIVRWAPINPENFVVLRLYNNDKVTSAERLVFEPSNNIPDTGEYAFTIPRLEPGEAYQFSILRSNGRKNLESSEFSIVGDTSGWQTYRNDKLGFEVKYPNEWDSIESQTEAVAVFTDPARVEFANMVIKVEQRGMNDNFQEWLRATSPDAEWQLGTLEMQTAPTGVPIYVVEEPGPLTYNAAAYVWRERMLIKISFTDSEGDTRPHMNQILSTFRFIEGENSLKPADAQTPAAGVCASPDLGDFATIVLARTADNVPVPRCLLIREDQRLQIKNATDETITVTLGRVQLVIAPGEMQADSHAFGSYLARGVHRISMSPLRVYEFPTPVTAPVIWLQ